MKLTRTRLFLGGVIIVFGLMIWFSLVQPNWVTPPSKQPNTPDFGFRSVKLTRYEHGQKVIVFSAKGATIELTPGVAQFWQLDGQAFSQNRPVLSFKAPLGKMQMQSGFTRLQNASGAVHMEGYDFDWKVPYLKWTPQNNRVMGEGGVSIEGRTLRAKASRFWMDLGESEVVFEGNPGDIFFKENPL
jgi:hypothetical protein